MTFKPRPIALGIILTFLLTTMFVTAMILLQRWAGIEDPFSRLNLQMFTFLVLYTLACFIVIIKVGIEKFGHQKFRNLGWLGQNRLVDIATGLGGGLAGACCIFGLGWIFGAWTWQTFLEKQNSFSFDQRLLFLLIGLNAGLIEETLFRGYIQPVFIAKTNVLMGILITSLLFALYHLNFQPLGFGGKLMLGVVFGALRARKNPLLRSSIAHAITWLVIGAL